MKKSTSISIGFMVVGGWLASSVAWAAPAEGSRVGGIPRCETELAECTIKLTETEGLLQVCEDALAQCEGGQAFPATGQTTCTGGDLECTDPAHAGQDGAIQAGAELSYTDTDNGLTITDNNTKLVWLKMDDNNNGDCANLPGSLDMDCEFTWDEAFAFVADLNEAVYAGHDDWRVPNIKELTSIVNYGENVPSISAEFNNSCDPGCTVETCSCTDIEATWSSTYLFGGSDRAWAVVWWSGSNTFYEIIDINHVRAVRGGLVD
jgi:hypothetical protein